MTTTTAPAPAANGYSAPLHVNGKPVYSHHLMRLRERGLSDETIIANGFYSEADRTKLAVAMGWKRWKNHGGAIVIPYRNESGDILQNRLRLDSPMIIRGKSAKYLSRKESGVHAYFPPGTREKIAAGASEIIITEGEFKAAAAAQAGYCCVGLSGVDCWRRGKSAMMLPELEAIEWKGVTVYIAFDSDAADNAKVKAAMVRLADTLAKRGAIVRIVWLPGGANGEKVGLDDFLVKHGAAALRKLMDDAAEPEQPDPESLLAESSELDPASEATNILLPMMINGLSRLRFWRGEWWLWKSGRYVPMPPEEVRAEVTNQLSSRFAGVRRGAIGDVMEHLRAKSILAASVEPPTWLDQTPIDWKASDCIATKNAIVHLPSLVGGMQPSQVESSPAFLTLNATDFKLDLQASQPTTWLRFLDAVWGEDQESIDTLQEWFGYCLTGDTRQHKIAMIEGPKRSGKSTIARILSALIGRGNVASPTLWSLATNFGLWPLVGKSLAIIGDARLTGRNDQAAVVERLLSISGEDSITVDRKNLQPITLRLPTRFLILTNELPKLPDASGTVVSRFILLRTTESFYGREDHDLGDKLLGELPGILCWAIEGWRRLHERGRFVQPSTSEHAIDEMEELASPLTAFVAERCEVGAGKAIAVSDLFAAWLAWCKGQGREKYAGNVQSFGRDLAAAIRSVRMRRPRVEEGERIRIYEGITTKPEY